MEKQNLDFRENTTHGDPLFPVGYYRCNIPESFRNLSFHWHEETEISYIEDGSANYTIDLDTVTVQKGDLLLISPHVLHGIDEREGCTMTSHSLVFHLNYLGCMTPDVCTLKYLNPLMTGTSHLIPVIRADHPGYMEMKHLFLNACDIFHKKNDFYELRMKSLLIELLTTIYSYGCVEKAKKDNSILHTEEKLKEILTFIHEHYSENLSIHDLANVCHFSETYLMNFFRRYTGTTCIEYINRYRLSKAAASLEETNLPVMDIAFESGFRNVSYFNKLFKNRFGCTPIMYRKSRNVISI